MQTIGDILVLDDDQPIVDFIAEALTDEGYIVRTSLTPDDARAAIAEQCPDLLLMDLYIRGDRGDSLLRDFKNDGLANMPVILMTADSRAAEELSMEGIVYYLIKPFDLDELVDCVEKHIRQDRMAA